MCPSLYSNYTVDIPRPDPKRFIALISDPGPFWPLEVPGQPEIESIIEKENGGYVSLCPELDIASQGDTVEQARDNLKEALELFFETASPDEIKQRLHGDIFVTQS